MLSVGVITAGGVGYYLDSVAAGVDDYYARTEPGRWLGAGAEALGLAGEVDVGQIDSLVRGLNPLSGESFGQRLGKVTALDLTFSAPKSVSLLAELADPAVRRAVREGHDQAVAATVSFLETEGVLVGRRGVAGSHQVETLGAVAAGFVHRTSRAGDPQLHTHVLLFNRAHGIDGRWGALHSRRVFAWAKTAGYVYQAALRAELSERLAVTWQPVSHGTADLTGIGDAQLDAFSTRRSQIESALERSGHSSARAAQVATLSTRPSKPEPIDPEQQRRAWQHRAEEVGMDAGALAAVSGRSRNAELLEDPRMLGRRLAGAHGLTEHRSTFDRRHLIQAVAEHASIGARPEQLLERARAVLTDPAFVELDRESGLSGRLYSTRELLNLEQQVLDGFDRRRNTGSARCPAKDVEWVIADRPTLGDEQAEMVRQLCCSGHGIEVAVGRAGTGKTYALEAARRAWSNQNVTVIGAALAARTAAGLQAGTGIASTTIDQLLTDLARPGAVDILPRGGVVVVDEAGMVGTRKMADLMRAAERARTKVVLVGDPRQLPEVEAGGAFSALAKRAEAVHLTTNRRQSNEWERQALDQLRHGEVSKAVAVYRDHQRITLAATAEEARTALVADWWDTYQAAGPEQTVMVGLTRADVKDLNQRARHHLQTAGGLGTRLDVADQTFAEGDLVMALRNDRRLGVTNGTRAHVIAVDHDDRALRIRTLDGRDLTLPPDYLEGGNLDHGYALTAHKAQGITVTDAFVLGSDRLYREAGYTAMSRATTHTQLYYQVASPPPSWQPAVTVEPDTELTRLLSRSAAQRLASEPSGDPIALRDAALADPGAHLLDRLGPPPPSGRRRDAWAAAATAIETYRYRYGVAGTDALGPKPSQTERGRDWEHANALAQTVETQLYLGIEKDQGLSL